MSLEPVSLEVLTIPCLSDNYAYAIHNAATGQTAVVDAPEAGPIQESLRARNWQLTDILITHHHHDHIGAVAALRRPDVRVVGALADAHRLPELDLAVSEGEAFEVCGTACQVMDVSGHTVGHIAFYLPDAAHVFTADSLMALGCGRLFEGTADQMWASLQKLAALPPETVVCSGHEYTSSNGEFALTVDPENAALISRVSEVRKKRAENQATVPSTLSVELSTNPFLRAADRALRAHIGMQDAEDAEVFAEVRRRKDNF